MGTSDVQDAALKASASKRLIQGGDDELLIPQEVWSSASKANASKRCKQVAEVEDDAPLSASKRRGEQRLCPATQWIFLQAHGLGREFRA